VVVGCGRVGSAVTLRLQAAGWDVAVIDERAETFQRLGEGFTGITVEGHALDTPTLVEAGIDRADAVVVATNGDNTNIVCAQIAQKRYGIGCVVVRVLDPRRAEFFAKLGLRTISPTQTAISTLVDAVRACEAPMPLSTPVVEVEA